MSSCNHSSNLSGNVNINNVTSSGARLVMTHPLGGFSGGRVSQRPEDDGVTAGDAIRYNALAYHATSNPSGGKYIKAKADVAQNSEVVGIVESIDNVGIDGIGNSTSNVNVVISGQINYPDHRLVNATHIFDFDNDTSIIAGASGGNDIYFLSEVTAGVIQNLAPSEPTRIAKPVLQKAPDGDFTGHVVNYIGYQVGGEIISSAPDGEPDGTTVNVLNFGGSPDVSENYHELNGQAFSLNTSDPSYGNKTYLRAYKTLFGDGTAGGIRWIVSFVGLITSDYNKQFDVISNGKIVLEGTLEGPGKENGTYAIKTMHDYVLKEGDVLRFKTGSNYTLTSALKTAFFLPNSTSLVRDGLQITSIDNKIMNVPYKTYMKLGPDASPTTESIQLAGIIPAAQTGTVSIPDNVEMNKATIKSLNIEKADGTVVVEDLGDVLDKLKTDTKTLFNKVNVGTPQIDSAKFS